MQANWDAVIVGAGPAGSATATLLARMGMRVVVVDSATFPRQKVCGEYLSPDAWRVFEHLGLADQVAERGMSLSSMSIMLPSGRSLAMPYAEAVRSRPIALARWVLDEMLVRHAQAGGAEVIEAHRVRAVLTERGRATGVEIAPVNSAGGTFELRAPLIVAADGRQSLVVRKTGRVQRSRGRGLVGFKRHVAEVPASFEGTERTIGMYSQASGYVGVCAVEDGSLNVCGVIPRARMRDARGSIADALAAWLPKESELSSLLGLHGRRAEASDRSRHGAARWWTMDDVRRQRATPTTAGVLYVGDAMGTIEPLTGQGMTLAMASAELVRQTLQAAAGKIVDRSLQQAYASAWTRAFARQIHFAHALGWLLRHPRVIEWSLPAARLSTLSVERIVEVAYRATCRAASPNDRAMNDLPAAAGDARVN